jgi:hypothetical protein
VPARASQCSVDVDQLIITSFPALDARASVAREACNNTLRSGVLLCCRKSSLSLIGLLICALPPWGSIREGPDGHSLQKDWESWAGSGPDLGGSDIFLALTMQLGYEVAGISIAHRPDLRYIRAHGYPGCTRRPAIPRTQLYPAPGAAASYRIWSPAVPENGPEMA